ncbi:hypothetical protein C2G38_2156323 [Gigaspora rosea]|uniref:Uncharacterized protein n=1 Tax=Gigaspora rosea TaxID=44941 RepID=A0A397W4Q4_9GLOM|nr:hypothetical protein C2G38_2156323 [Gigaspora rosea]
MTTKIIEKLLNDYIELFNDEEDFNSALNNLNRKGWPKCGFNLVICSYELPLIKMNLTDFINITDLGIMHFAGAKSLTFLSLSGTKLTDVGMSALKGIPHLNLDFTQVSLLCRNILHSYIPLLQPVRLNRITKEACEDEYYDI